LKILAFRVSDFAKLKPRSGTIRERNVAALETADEKINTNISISYCFFAPGLVQ
jgi:hypothetical protein